MGATGRNDRFATVQVNLHVFSPLMDFVNDNRPFLTGRHLFPNLLPIHRYANPYPLGECLFQSDYLSPKLPLQDCNKPLLQRSSHLVPERIQGKLVELGPLELVLALCWDFRFQVICRNSPLQLYKHQSIHLFVDRQKPNRRWIM